MSDLMQDYKKYNQRYFQGKLPIIPCEYNGRLRKHLGRCMYRKKSKSFVPEKIEVRKGLSEEQERKTLLHEMSHVWAMIEHNEKGHGPYFWRKMTEIGYPKGHVFASGERDAWSKMKEHSLQRGDRVFFEHKGQRIEGIVLRINRRTISVQTGLQLWRVSPQLLTKIEG